MVVSRGLWVTGREVEAEAGDTQAQGAAQMQRDVET